MSITIKIVESQREKAQVMAIRKTVFIEEQKVPEEIEIDAHEDSSIYILALAEERPVGTARWRPTGEGVKLERFAVLPSYRSRGVGRALVEFVLAQVQDAPRVYLNAQEPVVAFYARYGFVPRGRRFYEAGILHIKMVWNPPPSG